MKENSLRSILFRLRVPGTKWRQLQGRCLHPLLPPLSAVIRIFRVSGGAPPALNRDYGDGAPLQIYRNADPGRLGARSSISPSRVGTGSGSRDVMDLESVPGLPASGVPSLSSCAPLWIVLRDRR